ncbi:hypothetical protein KGF57_004100 [Candida theae]|uniref:Uncharacterized protein n=1 Tax=Candida theae TaxID=1198502 RepID=A0AAD5BBT0_9ASCO|nr:uncharacterized protein KGF57_004100 [Candida theae]KAI5952984.1 hypothetical protein KGF57_004100 [Candida theae]
MNSVNSNHSSYSTPQPVPINILSPHSLTAQTATNSSPYNALPPLNTQQQPHQCLRHSASPGLASSSASPSTTSNNNDNSNEFGLSQAQPSARQHSISTNTHANSISPTSISGTGSSTQVGPVGATTATTVPSNSKNDLTSTPTLSSANINTIQNVAPTPNSARSMSIVSLERSARNSIVSVDENLRYHTRNDSSASLASIGHVNQNTFTMTPAGNPSSGGLHRHTDHGFDQGNSVSKMRLGHDNRSSSGDGVTGNNQGSGCSGSAILTDEESEYDTRMTNSRTPQSSDGLKTIPSTPVLGATATNGSFPSGPTSRGMAKPMHRPKRRSFKDETSVQHLKNDFRFKFHETYSAGTAAVSPPTIPTTPVSYHNSNAHIHSLTASPTSESLIYGGKHLHMESPLDDSHIAFTSPALNHDTMSKNLESPEMKSISSTSISPMQSSGPVKKLKSTSLIQQSLYLKKKLAFSKDLQIEFNNASDLTNTSESGCCGSKGALHSHLITMSPPLSAALSEAKFFAHLPPSSNVMAPSRRRLSSSLNETERAKNLPTSAGASGDMRVNEAADLDVGSSTSSLSKSDFMVSSNDHDSPKTLSSAPMTPLRAMQSVKEQNDLITKLNQKWNKSMINNASNTTIEGHSGDGNGGNNNSEENNKVDQAVGAIANASTGPELNTHGSPDLNSGNSSSVLHLARNSRKRSRRDSFEVDDDEDDGFDDYNYDHLR